jgi:hypothetical protein
MSPFRYVEPTLEELNSRIGKYTTDGITWIPYEVTPQEQAYASQQPTVTFQEWGRLADVSQTWAQEVYREQLPSLPIPQPVVPQPVVPQPVVVAPVYQPAVSGEDARGLGMFAIVLGAVFALARKPRRRSRCGKSRKS